MKNKLGRARNLAKKLSYAALHVSAKVLAKFYVNAVKIDERAIVSLHNTYTEIENDCEYNCFHGKMTNKYSRLYIVLANVEWHVLFCALKVSIVHLEYISYVLYL